MQSSLRAVHSFLYGQNRSAQANLTQAVLNRELVCRLCGWSCRTHIGRLPADQRTGTLIFGLQTVHSAWKLLRPRDRSEQCVSIRVPLAGEQTNETGLQEADDVCAGSERMADMAEGLPLAYLLKWGGACHAVAESRTWAFGFSLLISK